ncbi:MAG: FUN14 domain-containing protein [Candidatus Nitrosopolaris sp.]|jgi:uncharacterized membrane protein (Fun14 family)
MAVETLLFSGAGGFAIGAISGYALKRIIKIAAIILGAFFLGLAYLSYKGWVHADWNVIQTQTYECNTGSTTIHSLYYAPGILPSCYVTRTGNNGCGWSGLSAWTICWTKTLGEPKYEDIRMELKKHQN